MTDSATPIYNIVGELVALGPLRRELLPRYTAWINDLGAARFIAAVPRPFTAEQEERWYDSVSTGYDAAHFTIYERASGRPIGTTSLNGIDQRNGAAEFGILLGEADARGKGYGTEVTQLMLDYAFTALSLHSVMLRVLAVNVAGLRAYQKAGFREIGRRRASQLLAGEWIDTIYMDCLASEFESPVLARVFVPDEPR
jgi:RimJ/RimL family protein N-acetyltransferase